ncbi:MAG: carboxypeptidase regulatory-like domain-containing protein [Lewinellaceae bacterium]|nr:carboxypeptidase regulatory-like domain-containing protein [Lewinellaceae bacterium]
MYSCAAVTDFQSGVSVLGASVTLLTPDTSFERFTNVQGNFIFNIPEHQRADKYTIIVKKNGYKPDENDWYSGDTKPFDIGLNCE